MVVGENAKSHNSGVGSKLTIAHAVAAAMVALGSGTAYATDTVITNSTSTSVTLGAGDNLFVNGTSPNTGEIIVGSGTAVKVIVGSIAGSITNSGTISGGNYGIRLNASTLTGGITNSGSISGSFFGIFLVSSTLTGGITNSGSISGSFFGIGLAASTLTGGITNSGSISGGGAGIVLSASTLTGGITNSGSISDGNLGIGLAASTLTGGIINSGEITGNTGIELRSSNLADGLSNTGRVTGTNYSLYVDNNSTLSGGVTLAGSGATFTGTLGNAGLIAGGINVNSGARIASGINNTGSITSGSVAGISLASASLNSGLTNAGFITGVNTGVKLAASTLSGGINNSGSIGSGGYGINLSKSSLTGGITNSGVITGSTNSVLIDGASSVDRLIIAGSNTAQFVGAVNAPNTPVTIAGTATYTGSANFTVSGFSNEGTYALQPSAIAGANYTISGNYAQASGGILQVNVTSSGTAGDGTLSGNYGQLWVTGAATFDANSNINVLMTPDTAVSRGGTLTGVLRAGTLTSDGFTITDNSALINFNYSTSSGVLSLVAINAAACGATVSGTQAGPCEVAFDAPNLYVSPTGTISGGAQGVKVLSGLTTGEINNAGLISAITTGIQMAGATLTGGITNSGSIGGLAGIYLNASNLTGGLNNTGLVTGTNYSIYVDNNSTLSGGVTLAGSGSTFSGSLFNAGLIADGINVNSGALIASGLNNTGSITSGSVAGISIASASLNSGLTNTGAINGSVTGIQLASSNLMGGLGNTVKITGGNTGIKLASSNLTGGLNNSGIISGSLYSVYVDTASTLSGGIAITGTSATFVGDIYAPNVLLSLNTGSEFTNTNVMSVSGVLVSSGATFNLTNGVSSSSRMTGNINVGSGYVTNQGVVDVGARGGANTPTITGNFTQDASGTFRTTVVSDTAYGQLYVSGSATLAGTAQVSVSGVATALTQGGTLSGVISAGNALTGAFAEINTNSSIYRFTGAYTANSFDLLIAGTQQNAISNDVALYGSSAAAGAAVALDQIAINPGAMAPVIDTLDAKSGQAMANAVEQTLPALVGGSSQVSAQSQTAFNQVVQSRQTQIAGLSSGEGFAGNRDVWGKAFGSWANQSNLNNVAGYKVDSGGVAFGVDRQLSTRANIGFSLAYANSNVNSNSSVAPSSLQINSYQAGLYGDYALQPDLQLAYQLDGAINTNSSSRSLSAFAGTSGVGANAFGQYNSYVGHVGVGVKRLFSINPTTRITPELRVDYTVVETEGYTETRGGLLNLAMSSQTYQTLYTGANVRVDHTLKNGLNLSVNVGAAYNALNNQVQATSAYVGGGPSFVTNGLEVSPWLYNAGAGIGGMISKDVELNVRYNINFSPTNYTNQMVSANVKWLF